MTINEGWIKGYVVKHGISDKTYPELNKGIGLALHSIEGSIAGALDRFLTTDKNPDGVYTSYAQASCMFLNPLVGPMIQMHPITASTWTSGSKAANTTLWAVESEGRAGTPLNANQVKNMMLLAAEWSAHTGEKASRDGSLGTKNIFEHNEVSNSPTACPSGRYAPFYAALSKWDEKEDDMTPEEKEFLLWAPARLSAVEWALTRLTGAESITALNELTKKAGGLAYRVEGLERNGDTVARQNINGHLANHSKQPGGGGVPKHTHKSGEVEE